MRKLTLLLRASFSFALFKIDAVLFKSPIKYICSDRLNFKRKREKVLKSSVSETALEQIQIFFLVVLAFASLDRSKLLAQNYQQKKKLS